MSEQPGFDALLDYLARTRGFDFTGYKRASLMRRVDQAHARGRRRGLRRVPRLPARCTPTSSPRSSTPSSSTSPRSSATRRRGSYLRTTVATAAARGEAGRASRSASGAPAARRARRRTRSRCCWPRRSGSRTFARAREDLRDRRRRGGAGPGAPGGLRRAARSADVPQALRERYFDRGRTAATCSARTCAARSSSAATTSIQDAPISRIDLLLCRNTLMYFNAETQARILGRFHFALQLRRLSCSSARPRCCSATRHLFTPDRPEAPALPQIARSRRPRLLRDGVGGAPQPSPTRSASSCATRRSTRVRWRRS